MTSAPEVLRLRRALAAALQQHITAGGWMQHAVARDVGVAQPRVSDLMRGKGETFSLDTLLMWSRRLGLQCSITVSPSGLTLYIPTTTTGTESL